jgi:hypothetical protein
MVLKLAFNSYTTILASAITFGSLIVMNSVNSEISQPRQNDIYYAALGCSKHHLLKTHALFDD